MQAGERVIIVERDLVNGLGDAFLDGYDELREKISVAFPDIDVSGFMTIETEVPDNGDGGSGETEDEAKVEEEEREDDHESSKSIGNFLFFLFFLERQFTVSLFY